MKELSDLRHAVMKVRDEQTFVWTRQEQQRKGASWRLVVRIAPRSFAGSTCLQSCPCAAAETTNWRVLWFAFAEAVVLIGLAIWRVVSLKRFFEQKGNF